MAGEKYFCKLTHATGHAQWASPGRRTLNDVLRWCATFPDKSVTVGVEWRKMGGKFDRYEDTIGGVAATVKARIAAAKTLQKRMFARKRERSVK
jgi:hypothetical protein